MEMGCVISRLSRNQIKIQSEVEYFYKHKVNTIWID